MDGSKIRPQCTEVSKKRNEMVNVCVIRLVSDCRSPIYYSLNVEINSIQLQVTNLVLDGLAYTAQPVESPEYDLEEVVCNREVAYNI